MAQVADEDQGPASPSGTTRGVGERSGSRSSSLLLRRGGARACPGGGSRAGGTARATRRARGTDPARAGRSAAAPPSGQLTTPASRSTRRCLETAGWLISSAATRSPTLASAARSASTMRRRVGSASTASASTGMRRACHQGYITVKACTPCHDSGVRVLIVTSGSMGDVAPYTGLGVRLRAAGHEVTVATHAPFAPVFADAGLPFEPMPGDLRAILPQARGQDGRTSGTGPRALARLLRIARPLIEELGDGIAAAVREDPARGDPAVHRGRAARLPGGRGGRRPVGRCVPAAGGADRGVRFGAARRPVARPLGQLRGRPRRRATSAGPCTPARSSDLRRKLGLPHEPIGTLQHLAGRRPVPDLPRLQHRRWCPARPTGARNWRWSATGGRRPPPPGSRPRS